MQNKKIIKNISARNLNYALTDMILARKQELKLSDKDLMAITGLAYTTIKNIFAKKTANHSKRAMPSVGSRRFDTLTKVCEKLHMHVVVRLDDYYGSLDEAALKVIAQHCLKKGASNSNTDTVFMGYCKYLVSNDPNLEPPYYRHGAVSMLRYYQLFGGNFEIEVTTRDFNIVIPEFKMGKGGVYLTRPILASNSVFALGS